MISLEDCIAFSGLSENEVAAIGEHEHIPTIAASALADYLLKQPHGGEKIRAMIIDDIQGGRSSVSRRHMGTLGGQISILSGSAWTPSTNYRPNRPDADYVVLISILSDLIFGFTDCPSS